MLVNGINIILCGNRLQYAGATIAWVTQVEKNHAVVSLPASSAVSQALAKERTFTISALGEGQEAIARQYGGADQLLPEAQVPGELNFDVWETPVIAGSPARWLCEQQRSMDIGEQRVVIARILESRAAESFAPLVYRHDDYFVS